MTIAEHHSTRPVKAMMINIIDDSDNIGPSLVLYSVTVDRHNFTSSQPQGTKFTARTINI